MKSIERLFQYLDYKSIKPARFEKEIGISNGYLGTQLKRKADLGETIVNKIINYSLDLNLIWLLTGNGEMLKGQLVNEAHQTSIIDCPLCAEKDETIKALKEVISALRMTIDAINSEKSDNKAGFKQTG
ncbi:MAG: hypothetical protein V1775_18200 [Bacteroidota bacterium]